MAAEPGVQAIHRLDGSAGTVRPGDVLTVGTRPVMLTLAPGH
jgi:hypothetical protein